VLQPPRDPERGVGFRRERDAVPQRVRQLRLDVALRGPRVPVPRGECATHGGPRAPSRERGGPALRLRGVRARAPWRGPAARGRGRTAPARGRGAARTGQRADPYGRGGARVREREARPAPRRREGERDARRGGGCGAGPRGGWCRSWAVGPGRDRCREPSPDGGRTCTDASGRAGRATVVPEPDLRVGRGERLRDDRAAGHRGGGPVVGPGAGAGRGPWSGRGGRPGDGAAPGGGGGDPERRR